LFDLVFEVSELTVTFPKHEPYELGSQLRRSSNSAPANLAEGWSNKQIKLYLKGISRAKAEIRETRHHLKMAFRRKYINKEKMTDLLERYRECYRMLTGLEKSLKPVF